MHMLANVVIDSYTVPSSSRDASPVIHKMDFSSIDVKSQLPYTKTQQFTFIIDERNYGFSEFADLRSTRRGMQFHLEIVISLR